MPYKVIFLPYPLYGQNCKHLVVINRTATIAITLACVHFLEHFDSFIPMLDKQIKLSHDTKTLTSLQSLEMNSA